MASSFTSNLWIVIDVQRLKGSDSSLLLLVVRLVSGSISFAARVALVTFKAMNLPILGPLITTEMPQTVKDF